MENNKEPNLGKSRLDQDYSKKTNDEPLVLVDKHKQSPKINLFGPSVVIFGIFVFLVSASVFYRMYINQPQINTEDEAEVVYNQEDELTEGELDEYGLVVISDVEIEYEEPERPFHIERRQQFCAVDMDESHKLYSEYIGTRNRQIMEVKPRTVSEEQWIKEKIVQGAYKENLGVRETNYYWEYPTTGGTYVDLMRIYKCDVFNPGGRIIPIISVDEDGYIPEYEMGVMGIADMAEEDMVNFIQYLISLRHDPDLIRQVSKQSLGDYLTMTLEMDYMGNANWLKLKKDEEVLVEGMYKVNLQTGVLTYAEEMVVRLIEPSPEVETLETPQPEETATQEEITE